MILGTILLVLVIGAGVAGAWKYRSMVVGDDDRSGRPPLADELLVELARRRDAGER
ncbi:MAG TPA: hypothetical protein VFA82_06120 [Gaiellaceae bacterium]|nr:hypothetical protein [Gaiellaceae bacterium]